MRSTQSATCLPRGADAAATVAVLLLVLTAFDDRVRAQVSRRVIAHPSMEPAGVGRHAGNLVTDVVQAARDQSLGHALPIFTLAAAVLLLFMLRT